MHSHTFHRTHVCLSTVLLLLVTGMLSLNAQAQRTINDSDRVVLHGNTHPLARAEFDRGPAGATMPMEHMVMLLSVRPDAQAQLKQLLADQLDPKSPSFHKWLTPAEFGVKFGPTDQDIADVTGWLQKFGFSIEQVANGRLWINFSGDVQKVERAFQTNIRQYEVDGKMHFANAIDPSIPRALTPLVQGVVSLNNFPKHPNSTATQLPPDFNDANGAHFLAPADFATIYDVNPLYNASPAIDGTGQTIAIVGRTDININDVRFFRSFFGLPAKDPIFIHNGADPGDLGGPEETEADLDVEWSGAVAKNATIDFVISQSGATDGVDLSAQFIVNNNLANVMSTSFGLCESKLLVSGNAFWNNLWAQAAAQGITSFVSSGDSGAAACDLSNAATGTQVNVSGLASTPNNVAVGGTELNDAGGNFWAATNNPTDQSSVVSYIPEIAWNESGSVAGGSGLFSSGGGASQVYSKPTYQAGPGVPADGARDIPDVSLASAGHDGYLIIQGHTATASGLFSVGGTSAASPSFAGLMALVVQKTGSPQGNANPVFYAMAQNQFAGGTVVFHDATSGNNTVPGVTGFTATAGYDQVTGWGSVDAANMVNFWNNNAVPDFSLSATPASQSVNQGSTANYTVTLTDRGGFANTVNFSVSGLPTGVSSTFAPTSLATSGSSTLSISTAASTPLGSYTLTISGSDGVLTHTTTVTLVVTQPDFSISAAPATQTVTSGQSASYTVTIGAVNGYSGTVSFNVAGLPAGASFLFSPNTVTGSGSSNLTIATTSGTTPNGSYPLTITASDGVLTHSTNVTLVVTDFGISVSPASQTVVQGSGANYTVSLVVSTTFVGTVNFSVTGLPASVSTVFSPPSLTTSGSSTLSVSTTTSTVPGVYPFTISASDGVNTSTASATLVVDAIGDFGLTISPATQTVNQGLNIGYGVTVSSSGGFSGLVNLTVSGLPPGTTATLSPSAVQTSGLVSLSIVTSASTPGGTYTFTVTGTSGPLVRSATATLVVVAPDFSLSASPTSQEILVGQSTSYSVSLFPSNNYSGTVHFSVSGLPTGATGTFSPTSLTTSGTTTLAITTLSSTPPGTYPLVISGTDGALTHTFTVNLIVDPVPAADFSISVAPAAITIKRNSNNSVTVSISGVNGFAGTVSLNVSGLPPLVTPQFTPTSVSGSGTSTLKLTVDHRAQQGTFPLTITGTSGPLVHSTNLTLTIN